jgi:hypothetical protein
MKKKSLFLLSILTVTLSVFSVGSVRRALLFDTKIAYSDPTYVYVMGNDGGEHLAVMNAYPKTTQVGNPSSWGGSLGVSYAGVAVNTGLSHEALNSCKVYETHCETSTNNLCPIAMTGVFVVTSDGQVIKVWENPF